MQIAHTQKRLTCVCVSVPHTLFPSLCVSPFLSLSWGVYVSALCICDALTHFEMCHSRQQAQQQQQKLQYNKKVLLKLAKPKIACSILWHRYR